MLFNRIGCTDLYNVYIRCLAYLLIRGGRALRTSWPRPRRAKASEGAKGTSSVTLPVLSIGTGCGEGGRVNSTLASWQRSWQLFGYPSPTRPTPSNKTPRFNCNVSARNSGHYAAELFKSTPSTPSFNHQNILPREQTQKKKAPVSSRTPCCLLFPAALD